MLVAPIERQQGWQHGLTGQRRDKRALAVPSGDKPALLKDLQRLAQFRAGHVQHVGEVALRRQLAPLLQNACSYQVLDLRNDSIGQ